MVQVLASGSAITGSVNDSAVDLTIDWSPFEISFGAGGLLQVSMNDLAFSSQETLTQKATVRLLTSPSTTTVSQVPEPGTLALAGIALAGAGFTRRGRRD